MRRLATWHLVAVAVALLLASGGADGEHPSHVPPTAQAQEHDAWRNETAEPQGRSCDGRRLFILDLGEKFHRGLLARNKSYERQVAANAGFGPPRLPYDSNALLARRLTGSALRGEAGSADDGEAQGLGRDSAGQAEGQGFVRPALLRSGDFADWPNLTSTWYHTWPNALDVLFHSRAAKYPCRVEHPGDADVVFVPYYGSLDIIQTYRKSGAERVALVNELAALLAESPSFKTHGGKDHFMVLGRPFWDYISEVQDPNNPWGNNMGYIEPFKSMIALASVERPPWMSYTIGAPYPMAFHPPSFAALEEWTEFARRQKRTIFWSFAVGRRRASSHHHIGRAAETRERMFWQCSRSKRCRSIDCSNGACEKNWRAVMQLYLTSKFCVHPRGDSCTRRAVLDSMLAGCIPVLLEPCMADEQYRWLLGRTEDYSVYMNGTLLLGDPRAKLENSRFPDWADTEIEKVLFSIPRSTIRALRREVFRMIPRITFGGTVAADGGIAPPDYRDAFDHLVDAIALRAKKAIQKESTD